MFVLIDFLYFIVYIFELFLRWYVISFNFLSGFFKYFAVLIVIYLCDVLWNLYFLILYFLYILYGSEYIYVYFGIVWWNVVLNIVILGFSGIFFLYVLIFIKLVGLWRGVSLIYFFIVFFIFLLIIIVLLKYFLLCIILWLIVLILFIEWIILVFLCVSIFKISLIVILWFFIFCFFIIFWLFFWCLINVLGKLILLIIFL